MRDEMTVLCSPQTDCLLLVILSRWAHYPQPLVILSRWAHRPQPLVILSRWAHRPQPLVILSRWAHPPQPLGGWVEVGTEHVPLECW